MKRKKVTQSLSPEDSTEALREMWMGLLICAIGFSEKRPDDIRTAVRDAEEIVFDCVEKVRVGRVGDASGADMALVTIKVMEKATSILRLAILDGEVGVPTQ